MKDAWDHEKAAKEEKGYCSDRSETKSEPSELYDLNFDIKNYAIKRHRQPKNRSSIIKNFLKDGKTIADTSYFHGLECHFDFENYGRVYIYIFLN